jgi:hypothetical protein
MSCAKISTIALAALAVTCCCANLSGAPSPPAAARA